MALCPSGLGCQLPDAVLHGKRSLRPRNRTGNTVPRISYRVRFLGPAQERLRAPHCQPCSRSTHRNCCRTETLLVKVGLRFWRSVCLHPRVSPLTSQVTLIPLPGDHLLGASWSWRIWALPGPWPSLRALRPFRISGLSPRSFGGRFHLRVLW